MKKATKKKFTPGEDWVWYAPNTKDAFGQPEIDAVHQSLERGWLTAGPIAKEFEDTVARMFGKKLGLFVNSGSSANLLAFAALDLPKGSEVITPACNFNTTVAPIIQSGLTPVFVDVKRGMYTIDTTLLEKALSKKTKVIIAPHLIGNLVDLSAIRAFAKKHNLIFIEDSCDTIGATYKGKPIGAYSDITTTSFYASHLVTAGGSGGMVMFNNKKDYARARVFRNWGRGISRHDEKIRSRLATFSIDGAPYDSAFVFVEQGYNMIPTEMQAAFGLTQMKRLKGFTDARKKNFKKLYAFLEKHEDLFILPKEEPGANTNWLAFPITLSKKAPFDRNALARYLEDHKIQTRPLFSGNITKHPAYKGVGRVAGSLKESDHILHHSLLVGMHHGLTDDMITHMCNTIESFIKKYR